MKQKLTIALSVLVLLCAITGCIEYERQTMSYRHDPATDTLFIFQDYQGIFGRDDSTKLSEAEIDQLSSVITGERTFFFSNWITEYNRERLEEAQRTPKGELHNNPAYEEAIRQMAGVALANVKVDNVGLYLNSEKQLCGSQRVTVNKVSTVLAALNHLMLFVAREEAEKEGTSTADKTRLLRFADSGQKMFTLEGNRLEVRWPVSEADYRSFRNDNAQAIAFREAGGTLSHADGMILITLGTKDAKSVSITLPFAEKPYTGNALAEAKKHGIKDSFNAAAAAKAFLQPIP